MQMNTFLLDRNRHRKVVFYGRVSTEHEAQLSALENQMQWYEDIAKRYPNWQVVDKYIDEGITGTQAKKRPAFMKMIADAETGKFDLIVTREVCRFARNTVDTLTHTRALKNLDIEVFFVDDNIWTMDGDGELRLTIMATLAQEESRKVSERVRAGQRISRENKTLYGSGNILGYNRVDGTYVIDSEQAETVQTIFDLYEQGYGTMKIAKILREQGRLTATGTTKWTCSNVSRVLRNATYKGCICYNKSHVNNYLEQKRIHNLDRSSYVYVKGDFEPIISEEQWEKCNKILNSKRKSTLVQNGETVKKSNRISTDLWVQKLRCVCGSSFRKNRYHKDKDGKITYNYVCYNQVNNVKATEHKDGDGFCNEASITQWKMDMMAELLLQSVWQCKKDELMETLDGICDYYKATSKQNCSESVIFIESQIEKVEQRKKSLITMFADGNLTQDEYAIMKAEYNAEIKKLCEQRERQSEQENIMNGCISEISAVAKQLGRMLESSSPVFQRDRLNEHIRSVVADNRKYTWNVTINPSEENIYSTAESDVDCAVIRLGESASILSHLHRLHFAKVGNLQFALVWDFKITYEMAKNWRKAHNAYLRQNQWKDLTVRACLDVG